MRRIRKHRFKSLAAHLAWATARSTRDYHALCDRLTDGRPAVEGRALTFPTLLHR